MASKGCAAGLLGATLEELGVAWAISAGYKRQRRDHRLCTRAANHVWAYDFVFDACANGQQIKCLTIVDEFTHECRAIDVAGLSVRDWSFDVLARLISLHGAPAYLRSGSGPEFVSQAILKWLTENRIDTAVIDPGKPWQNGTNESFIGKLRDECLSLERFRSRREASVLIEGVAPALQRRASASELELLDPERIQAAPSVPPNPSTTSRFPGIRRPNFRRQVTFAVASLCKALPIPSSPCRSIPHVVDFYEALDCSALPPRRARYRVTGFRRLTLLPISALRLVGPLDG